MKDKRPIEERVAYQSFLGISASCDNDAAAYQEGWMAAMAGESGKSNPYAIDFTGVLEEGLTPEQLVEEGKKNVEQMNNHCRWMYGYNHWAEFSSTPSSKISLWDYLS